MSKSNEESEYRGQNPADAYAKSSIQQLCDDVFGVIAIIDRLIGAYDQVGGLEKDVKKLCEARETLADIYGKTGCTDKMLPNNPKPCSTI